MLGNLWVVMESFIIGSYIYHLDVIVLTVTWFIVISNLLQYALVILRVYLIQLYDVDVVDFRTRKLIHCDALLYIDKGGRHQVRPVCPYWLRADAADRNAEDHDSHGCSFAGVPKHNILVSTKWWFWVHGTYHNNILLFHFLVKLY